MFFDLDNLNPGTWFDLPGGGKICLRILPLDDAFKISKEITKKRVEYKQGQRFEVEDVDEHRNLALTWDYIILDWEGVKSKDGKEIPCTTEMKARLMGGSPSFGKVVRDFVNHLNELEATEQEAEAKN